ncbi:hypothetical protein WJX72_004323 [[Myrmecia] bisecta]|uniref:Pullulanase n=1 Tax=[Myrmecia] bisecta TaxID=41462 RepID=A0AAW1QQU5_9CHLO
MAQEASPPRIIRVSYLRPDGDHEGWGLHLWGDSQQKTDWAAPLPPDGVEEAGPFWDVALTPGLVKHNFNQTVGFTIHRGDGASAGGELVLLPNDASALWLVHGSKEPFFEKPDLSQAGDLTKCCAHWLTPDLLVWRQPGVDREGKPLQFKLHWSPAANVRLTGGGISGAAEVYDLTLVPGDLPYAQQKKFPHLAGCTCLALPQQAQENAAQLVTGQLAVSVQSPTASCIDATGLQLPGVLDELLYYEGPLGSSVSSDHVWLHVWAPTATHAQVLLFDEARGGQPAVHDMQKEEGTWSCQGSPDWLYKYYKYRLTVYSPWNQQVVTLEVTDPYSRSLAADGERTQIVVLDAPQLQPDGWATHAVPPLAHPTDISIYELHIRDFSATDQSVDPERRGKYSAFSEANSHGIRHLKALQAAGMNHVHLLPSYDFGSVPERREDQKRPQVDLSQFASDSTEQQEHVLSVANLDAFNWGYDPVHYGVPEGSYASDPDGPARILEHRGMVKALHELGFRVVLDVVYNHTFHAGTESRYSVLDKVVPGYYHRRSEKGDICMTTCCNNTASEHAMCERLILDDIVHWAVNYKVDGFRFDIMGHIMESTMRKLQDAVRRLTRDKDGVDGKNIYLYGEAWDFGEVACNQRGRNASQLNIGGMGLGSFNDRFRDALVGGGPFSSPAHQGFATGLLAQPNAFTLAESSPEEQRRLLLDYTDLLRLSLAGNLKDYQLQDAQGRIVKGVQQFYGSSPAAYACQPEETVNYAACHDGETLFDQVILKAAAEASIEQRVRMVRLMLALTAFTQGVAFFHAGDEILRSKSLDRDSYNSGDWFNAVDWTYQTNNFGVGAPPATKNEGAWPLKRPLLARADLKPSSDLIRQTRDFFLDCLRIREASPLFRLRTADQIHRQLHHYNTGPDQVAGVVVMEVCSSDAAGFMDGVHDANFKRIVVVCNASLDTVTQPWPADTQALELHPIHASSADVGLRACSTRPDHRDLAVTGLTVAVFVEPRT